MQKRGLFVLLLLILVVISGCEVSDTVVDSGDYVEYYYTMSLDSGELIDTNIEEVALKNGLYKEGKIYLPAEIVIGDGQIATVVEQGMIGMKLEETKKFRLRPEEAYGVSEDDTVYTFSKNQFMHPDSLAPQELNYIVTEDGIEIPYYIVAINGNEISASRNHPLADKHITFDITVVWIESS